MGDVDAEGKDAQASFLECDTKAIDGLEIGVDGDDFGTSLGGKDGVSAGIAAYVEQPRRLGYDEGLLDEGTLGGMIFVTVVAGGVDVLRPVGGVGRWRDAAHLGEQIGEGLHQDLARDFGVRLRGVGASGDGFGGAFGEE